MFKERLAAYVRKRIKRKAYPLMARRASLVIEYADGSEDIEAIFIGKITTASTVSRKQAKDENAKKKILSATPGKDDPPATMEKIFNAAHVGVNSNSRDRLWELVDEGEIISLRYGFRKTK